MWRYIQHIKWWIIGYAIIVLIVSVVGNFTLPTMLISLVALLLLLALFDMNCYQKANMLYNRYARLQNRLNTLRKNEQVPEEYWKDFKKLEVYIRNNRQLLKKYEDVYLIERQAVKRILKEKRKMLTTK